MVAGGLVGAPRARRFALEQRRIPEVPFHLMVGLDGTGICLVVCDADALWPTYADEVRAAGGVAGECSVLAIVTSRPGSLTANLLAPLVVDPVTGAGRQLVLEGSRYGTRHAIPAAAHF